MEWLESMDQSWASEGPLLSYDNTAGPRASWKTVSWPAALGTEIAPTVRTGHHSAVILFGRPTATGAMSLGISEYNGLNKAPTTKAIPDFNDNRPIELPPGDARSCSWRVHASSSRHSVAFRYRVTGRTGRCQERRYIAREELWCIGWSHCHRLTCGKSEGRRSGTSSIYKSFCNNRTCSEKSGM